MQAVRFLALAATLAGCATAQPDSRWSELDQRGLWEILKLSERNATSFSSHQELLPRAIEKYRDRFAPTLSLASQSGTITIKCEDDKSERLLPATAEESAATFVALSPLLANCLEAKRLDHFSYQQAVSLSILAALDRYCRLVLPEAQSPVPPESTLAATPEIVGSHGYLPIPSFGAGAADYVAATLRGFHEQDIHGLVVDLRGNSGGLVTEISKSLGHFAAPGTHLFSVRGRAGRNSADHKAVGPDLVPNVTLVVLVDRFTSSGGELAALALRQLRSALIVGGRTSGYSSIQTVYPLTNGWGVAITTAAWIAPGNARIPETGVIPDVMVRSEGDSHGGAAADQALVSAFEVLPE